MPKKMKGMTIEQHIALGKKLKKMEELEREVLNEVQHAYGKSSRVGQAVRRFFRVGTLKYEMDALLCRETDSETWHREGYGRIYYGADYPS